MRSFQHYAIPAIWIAWLVYWTLAARGTKPNRREESVASRLSHIIPLSLAVGLLATTHVPAWLAAPVLPWRDAWFWLGFCLVVIGVALSVAARIHLGGNWSGTVTVKQGHDLIRSGPYRWVRHPTYTGLLLALLGSAIALDEWRGPVAVVLATLALLRKIAVEESFLAGHFGDAHARYRAEVPALLPVRRAHAPVRNDANG